MNRADRRAAAVRERAMLTETRATGQVVHPDCTWVSLDVESVTARCALCGKSLHVGAASATGINEGALLAFIREHMLCDLFHPKGAPGGPHLRVIPGTKPTPPEGSEGGLAT